MLLGSVWRRLVARTDATVPVAAAQGIELALARDDAGAVRGIMAGLPSRCSDPRLRVWRALLAVLEGRDAEAAVLLEGALADAPGDPRLPIRLGEIARRRGLPDDAVRWWRHALPLAPGAVGLQFNLAAALADTGRLAEATGHARAAVAEMPGDARPALLLGNLFERSHDPAAAAALYERLCADRPELLEAWAGLGRARRDQADFAAAEAAFARAGADFLLDVVLARYHQRRHADAVAAADALIEDEPQRADARLARANALLAAGDMARGWTAYEARLVLPGTQWPARPAPAWNGEPVDGTLLVDCEQGFGDCLFAARFLPDARARARRLVLRAPAPLARLFAASGLADEVLTDVPPTLEVRAHAFLLSLPGLIGAPAPRRAAAYLEVPDACKRAWRERLAGAGPAVGLVWSGATSARLNRFRMFDPRALAARMGGRIRLYSLQLPAAGVPTCPPGVTDLSPDLSDFAETGAALAALDTLVSTETAVAHLAGALGVRALVPLPATADWRWEIAGRDNPWYASIALFRPSRPGAWDEAWEWVDAALR